MKKIEDKMSSQADRIRVPKEEGGKRLRKKAKNPEVKARRGGDGASSRKGSREICKRIVGGWDWISDFSGGGLLLGFFFLLVDDGVRGQQGRGLTFGASVAGLCAKNRRTLPVDSEGNAAR
ncbi:hypothetical protein L211DRAFT_192678 [Terfezia boudieri ATCC MYA-4762]|uniref:Uncharacterized protein n=1 Tax=Terfezia boudieri ATCC MYA-4762 TaxID=1051890 RepID=A0A3N4LUK7_9PEZI|nr:hypothetical protein L211DRAFT_192678 [Terfezia boudieri ATCC MYA-4762]